ncbi:DUF3027 domain-containing protein [Amycolatopsis nalaikhensis]|uniref:DUF3027 domain-containing protein n=1 Tax=Amycolatopsis nalaikhensis TaxID=715472 RepID=UPI003DA1491D
MTLLLTLDDGSVQRKLADAVEFARAAVLEDAPEEQIGAHVGATREDAVTASHLFEAQVPGYKGWRWSVTVALAGEDEPVTVSEVVLVPGPSALVAPAWVPWERRVRAGDLGVGDIFPTDENDPRLAPAYLQSDDPAVEEVAHEAGLGRVHVLSRFGRTEAASRWHAGEFGPRSDMARSAPDVCGTCGFFVPLAGSLRGVFGVCSNDIAPADGHVVDVEYGCGAHSEVEVEVTSSVPVAELVYDDSLLDFTPGSEVVETAAAEGETGVAEADLGPAEVEPELAAQAGETDEAAAVGAPEFAEVAAEAAEPVEAEAAEVAEPVAVEATEPPAEPIAPEAAEPVEAAVTEAVAEPVEAEAAAEVAEPVAEEAPAEPIAAEAPAEPVAPEAAEPAAPLQPVAPETAEVAEPVTTEVLAEPIAPEAEPENAAAAEHTGATVPEIEHAAAAEPVAAEQPAAAEPAASPAEPQGSAPVEAEVPEPAEAEPTQAEVTDAVAEPEAAEVPETAAAEPEAAEAQEPAEAEPSQADVTTTEGADLQTPAADEAQAQVDTEDTRDQRDA